jgi:hypothetical protein
MIMITYADLEVGVDRIGAETYLSRMRLHLPPRYDIPIDLLAGSRLRIELDVQEILERTGELEYGKVLGEFLFGPMEAKIAFERAVALAGASRLRIRLGIDSSAQDLHALVWEKLVFPGTEEPLPGQQRFPFSRYIESADPRLVHLRRREDLRALLVVANPDLSEFEGLQSFDPGVELAAARENLAPMPVESLDGEPATLERIEARLRGRFDILYLLCHGTVGRDGPVLLLENSIGKAHPVMPEELSRMLRSLEHRPRLIVLSSCHSAGGGLSLPDNREAFVTIGPLLAADGIPAVVAMQGDVQARTASRFIGKFFAELRTDGLIDRAVAVARETVRQEQCTDWWMPVLFMRLERGLIRWYDPGFAQGEEQASIKWDALLDTILNTEGSECTPILGIGLQETIVGSRRSIAEKWAQMDFPLTPRDPESFTHVAQFVAIKDNPATVQIRLNNEVRERLLTRFGSRLEVPPEISTTELLRRVGELLRKGNPEEPHRVIASLPAEVFITVDPSTLLEDALTEAGKSPRSEFCRWREDLLNKPKTVRQMDRQYVPSVKQPLVFHLFGRSDYSRSLVLTENDYFEYLIGVMEYKDKNSIPPDVLDALRKSLLFVGFQLEDWAFRAVYRLVLSLGGSDLLLDNTNVAAQVDPEAERMSDPLAARAFIEGAFKQAALSIYWGEVEDFVADLQQRLDRRRLALAGKHG